MADRGKLPVVTRAQLAQADGRSGRPAWVAVSGLVYDVTHLFLWKGGRHFFRHTAGRDLTSDLAEAPHGPELLARARLVGRLEE